MAAITFPAIFDRLQRYVPAKDVGLAVGVVVLLSVLVLPLPRVMLDVGLALSITYSFYE